MKNESPFPDASFVMVKLLKQPIYREDEREWNALLVDRDDIRHHFRKMGQELVLDEAEGYAFIRQIEMEDVDKIPRLAHKRPLNYHATLLLVCLRQEFCTFDTSNPDATRLIKSRQGIHDLVAAYLPETTNQVRDVNKIDAAIQRLVDFGFLRLIDEEQDTFEVMRIVKAKVGPTELESIKERILKYAETAGD
ncbi:MAG: DUF4194 domain-containing protein [Verrucomicrobia bacterium]|nr:DUF4194 domain-containing protein [Verrucomicrobiota bacterium]